VGSTGVLVTCLPSSTTGDGCNVSGKKSSSKLGSNVSGRSSESVGSLIHRGKNDNVRHTKKLSIFLNHRNATVFLTASLESLAMVLVHEEAWK
jgi:hypothetical protein